MEPIAPIDAGLPAARSALAVVRHWSEKKEPQKEQTHTRFFLSSLSAAKDKSRAAQAVRGHWAIENRNHYKRDASPWQEDRHRHRRPKAALNLALTRNALLAIIPFDSDQPLSHFFELYHRHPAAALNLILHARPVL
jgi:predicted transposase YbfD/YdcC